MGVASEVVRCSSHRPVRGAVARGDKGPAFFVYSDNYLIDVKFGVIVDQMLRAW